MSARQLPNNARVAVWVVMDVEYFTCDRPVIILTANSDEVVIALSQMQTPDEMNQGDVYKISLPKRLGYTVQLDI